MAPDRTPAAAKALVRRQFLDRRAAIPDLPGAAAAVLDHVLAAPWSGAGGCVAAYAPVGSEPGSVELLDRLRRRGVRVLLPVVAGEFLDWSAYAGVLVPGPWGLLEPAGARLGPAALAATDAVLVPALAADRSGTRLGRGAGYYDRALTAVRPLVPLVALLHDGELVDYPLPAEPHDIGMTAVITPGRGLVAVGPRPAA